MKARTDWELVGFVGKGEDLAEFYILPIKPGGSILEWASLRVRPIPRGAAYRIGWNGSRFQHNSFQVKRMQKERPGLYDELLRRLGGDAAAAWFAGRGFRFVPEAANGNEVAKATG